MERNYEMLAQAIIVAACNDYRRALKKLKKHPLDFEAKHTKKECLEFFKSSLFSGITELNSEYIICKMHEEVGWYES